MQTRKTCPERHILDTYSRNTFQRYIYRDISRDMHPETHTEIHTEIHSRNTFQEHIYRDISRDMHLRTHTEIYTQRYIPGTHIQGHIQTPSNIHGVCLLVQKPQ